MSPGGSEKYQNNDKKWESLLRISEEAHTATNIEEFVATVHVILADLVMAKNFFICLYDEATNKYFFPYFEDEFDNIETAGVNVGYDESLEVTLYDGSGTLTDYVRRTGNPVRFPNEEMNLLYESGEIKLFGSQSTSWLGVPLKLSGNTVGVMALQCYDIADAYSVKDEELMVFVSDHIARAIERVRAEEKIRKQHLLVLQQKQAITDSISYARRIQKAVLPSPAYIDNILSDYFTIYKPKDIIGGDFYWVREIDGYKVVIVADSTGHGVPGALMSMLGVTLLNEQFRTFGIRQPGVILGHLRSKVKEILAQEGSVNDQKEGIDMAIAIIDQEKNELQFAGANRPLFLFRKKEQLAGAESIPYSSLENDDYELYTIKGDKQPIGVHWEEQEFTNQRIKLQEHDSLYIFSDGYVDQYGGEKRKKFKTRNFKKLLLSVQAESMKNQRKLIEEAFDKWRGSHEQIDDVCVIGVRVSFP
ncbi:MAG: SpoIIE family protein phosphatase [Bacteroidales bacterium]|nr:SpoIIE family protein phosphatase [Bacteroidales bacterium]